MTTGGRWSAVRERLDAVLDGAVRVEDAEGHRALAAARYALGGGGKRLRGILTCEAFAACGGTQDVSPLAVSLEIIHTYSLVHDDLPCMDDDAMRRGRPTTHRAYDVAAATRGGLALIPIAIRVALAGGEAMGLPWSTTRAIVRHLALAAGSGGMIGGQFLDITQAGRERSLERIDHVHALKTGALFRAAAVIGGMAATASDARIAALDRYGARVGLAFQIVDDLLDVTGTPERVGKSTGRDAALGKATYPAVLGVAGARSRASALLDDALAALDAVALRTPSLEALARLAVDRQA